MHKYWLVLIIGIVLRLFLSASTFHPDIRALDLAGRIIASGNFLNLYDYLGSLPKDNMLLKAYPNDLFIYPPGIYFFYGFFSFIFQSFVSIGIVNNFLVDYPQALGNFQLNLHLMLLKIPYMLADLPAAFFLSRIFVGSRARLLVFAFWIFNPVALYATYMMGQFDILPTFFVILALYLLNRSKEIPPFSNIYWAALALGVGATFKIYPLYLLIPLAALQKKWKDRIIAIILGFLPYLILILPFLPSSGYRSSSLFAGQIFKSFYAQIPISGGESILIFLALVIFFYLLFLHVETNVRNLWQNFFIIILLFLMLTHYHPQWFLWVTPFLIIDLVKNKFKHILPILLSFGSFFGLLFFFESSLTLGLFSPIWHNLYNSPGLFQLLNLKLDANLMRSILQTIFVGSGIYFIYHYFPKKHSS